MSFQILMCLCLLIIYYIKPFFLGLQSICRKKYGNSSLCLWTTLLYNWWVILLRRLRTCLHKKTNFHRSLSCSAIFTVLLNRHEQNKEKKLRWALHILQSRLNSSVLFIMTACFTNMCQMIYFYYIGIRYPYKNQS